ncbi:7-cyano-7-deazaguanine synthase [Bienertia sinuspersici]
MGGYVNRTWSRYRVDKVIDIQKGLFLIRFHTMEDRDKIPNIERPFFDSKPVVIKSWNDDMDPTKDIVKSIPIWIHVAIIDVVGKLIRLDETTTKREKLSYARVMVEVEYDQSFPDSIPFYDKKRPTHCTKCKKVGHLAINYYSGQEKTRKEKA